MLTNFIFTLANFDESKDMPFIIAFVVTMILEIIHHGYLLHRLTDELQDNQKFHSVFFIGIMIAWRIASMNLMAPVMPKGFQPL